MSMMFPMDPDEARAAIKHEQMKQALHMHTFFAMLDKMTPDELGTLASILEGCMASEGVAPQIYGQVKTILRIKHDVCPCDQKHDTEVDVDEFIKKFTAQANGPVTVLKEEDEAGKAEDNPF